MNSTLEIHSLRVTDGREIAVISCGKMTAASGHSVPPRCYPNHSFTFVLRGKGVFRSPAGTFSIGEGNGFWIEAGSTVSYVADTEDPWEYIFVTFGGSGCPELLRNAGISAEHPTFDFPNDGETLSVLEAMLRAGREDRCAGYDALGHFLVLAGVLIARSQPTYPTADGKNLDGMIQYIEANYNRNVTVEELADRFFTDRSSVYRLFRRRFGISPKKYILNVRIQRASRMLADHFTISEVAQASGFFDRSHFERSFRSVTGFSPGEFRKNDNM